MSYSRILIVSALGIGVIITGYGLHSHIVKVKAAKLEHIAAPAPYFPAGAIWTQEISHAPLDPQSSAMIDWLAGAGGWGHGRMQVDFSLRVLQADAATPRVPFRKAPGFFIDDSDSLSTFPLPAGGGIEGQTGYQCNIDQDDCHLLVADRAQGKLYEAYQANYWGALSALFLSRYGICIASIRPRGAEINALAPMQRAFPSLRCYLMPTNSLPAALIMPFASFFPIRGFARTFLCTRPRTPVRRADRLKRRRWERAFA